jgi:NAD(P) transhydrogenase subunit alpha
MIIGALKETNNEKRCALTPEVVVNLLKMQVAKVIVESGLGVDAGMTDAMFETAGASIATAQQVLADSDILLSINSPTPTQIASIKPSALSICAMNPFYNQEAIQAFVQQKNSAFALELVPRTTRGQAMDIMSSQATVAGYKAVLTAATLLPKFFPMFMTAAGSIKPAKILVLGAGVAGLQSIATSRKLGAVVEAFDVRSAVKEEVVSLGAKFVEVAGAVEDKAAGGYAVEQTEDYKAKQAEAIHNAAIKADVIIATAQIPGRTAPILIRKETVAAMQPGSVIIDLAASTGGNVEGTINNQTTTVSGVTIVGDSNLASSMPGDASKMFARNILNLLKLMIDKEGNLNLNFEDDIIAGACVTKDGIIMNERLKK